MSVKYKKDKFQFIRPDEKFRSVIHKDNKIVIRCKKGGIQTGYDEISSIVTQVFSIKEMVVLLIKILEEIEEEKDKTKQEIENYKNSGLLEYLSDPKDWIEMFESDYKEMDGKFKGVKEEFTRVIEHGKNVEVRSLYWSLMARNERDVIISDTFKVWNYFLFTFPSQSSEFEELLEEAYDAKEEKENERPIKYASDNDEEDSEEYLSDAEEREEKEPEAEPEPQPNEEEDLSEEDVEFIDDNGYTGPE